MADVLEKGLAWLDAMNRLHRSVPVTYRRDGRSVTLPATVGKTSFHYARDAGPFESFESRDYIVAANDLALDGQPFLPRPGDRIVEAEGGMVFLYEVMSLEDEPPFRWCDPYRRTLRIHTKYVGAEPASQR